MSQMTLVDILIENAETYPSHIYLTQPTSSGVVNQISWLSALNIVKKLSFYLESLDLKAGSRIAIYGDNSAYWILSDLAIMMAGHVSVPIYKTMSKDSILYVLEHSESALLIVDKLSGDDYAEQSIQEVAKHLALPVLKTPFAPATIDGEQMHAVMLESELSDGARKIGFDDLSTIIYTSGSTGKPKGVMHSNRTMLAVTAAFEMNMDDRLFSYLPLAHAAERALVETCSIYYCVPIFFLEQQESFIEDVKRCQPTIFFSVPRLWGKFKADISNHLPSYMESQLLSGAADQATKEFIKEQLGLGKVRLAITGSAPTPSDVLLWFRAIGLELLDCYGMSENFATSHITLPGKAKPGFVGEPTLGVEHKISEAGEVLVKSPGQMLGYYKNQTASDAELTDDGYLHTGDLGEIDESNRLKITGRIKDIFKSSKGKYISPAPIESLLLGHDHIQNACVMGQGLAQPFAVAQVTAELDADVVSQELEQFLEIINCDLPVYERLSHMVLLKEEWNQTNGLLTPTQKIVRSNLENRYMTQYSKPYGNIGKVFWG